MRSCDNNTVLNNVVSSALLSLTQRITINKRGILYIVFGVQKSIKKLFKIEIPIESNFFSKLVNGKAPWVGDRIGDTSKITFLATGCLIIIMSA